jgi:hypothetical protein
MQGLGRCDSLLATIADVPKRRRRTTESADAEAALKRLIQAWQRGGKTGGPKGGKARWEGVPPEKRREILRKAALARWAKTKRRSK